MSIKLKGSTDGSVTLQAPADTSPTGTDKTLILPTGVGSANQFLQNGSTAGTLEFGALVSGDMPTGSILQVVQGSTSTEVVATTTTYIDTGLSASITPSSSSNKVLVIVNQEFNINRQVVATGGGIKLLRGSTTIHEPLTNTTGPHEFYASLNDMYGRATITVLDSPATTSSITYKTQGRPYTTANNGKVTFQYDANVQNGTSYITLIEVAA